MPASNSIIDMHTHIMPPEWEDIGIHLITVVFEGDEISEQEITIYVFNKELLDAEQKDKSEADEH